MKPEDIHWLDEEDSEQPAEEPVEEAPAEEPEPQKEPRKKRSFSWIFVVIALMIGVFFMIVTGGFKKLFGDDQV